jgi:hypothetical protein
MERNHPMAQACHFRFSVFCPSFCGSGELNLSLNRGKIAPMITLQSLRKVLVVETWSLASGPGASQSSKTEAIPHEPILAIFDPSIFSASWIIRWLPARWPSARSAVTIQRYSKTFKAFLKKNDAPPQKSASSGHA